ncbi:hypothetical protein AVEN_158042-1 [Araneus ventricosus]|uniref:Uncharacterized protein n=1 Tax=Araneus ventricosus TaxID=182803 RepID=A0A4Y2RN93_ARAVE|nr:hypothetical protein AVEN_158042-1 [Araneus ventricosus]
MIPIYSCPITNDYTIYVHPTHYPDFLKNHILKSYTHNDLLCLDLSQENTNKFITLEISIAKDNFHLYIRNYDSNSECFDIIRKCNNVEFLHNLIVNDSKWTLDYLKLFNLKTNIVVDIITTKEQNKLLKDYIKCNKMIHVGYLAARPNLRNVKNIMYLSAMLDGYYQKPQEENDSSNTDLKWDFSSNDSDDDSDYTPSTESETVTSDTYATVSDEHSSWKWDSDE